MPENNFSPRAQQNGQRRLSGRPPRATVYNVFDEAIRRLIPDRRKLQMLELFDGRVTYETIHKWRQGKRRPPQWALEALAARAATDPAATLAQRIAKLPTSITNDARARNLAAWRARKAREADEAKEKGAG